MFCWFFFQTALVGVELTKRGCYANDNDYFDDGECKELSMDGNSGTVCVCESNLCNGVEKMLPHFTMFLMTTLISCRHLTWNNILYNWLLWLLEYSNDMFFVTQWNVSCHVFIN